jgi:hypothetical protein
MLVCHGCHRHVRVEEPACPFCSTVNTAIPAPYPARLAPLTLTAGLTLLACGTDEGESDDMTTANSNGDTTLGDGNDDPNDTADTAVSEYGGPDDWGDGDGDPDTGDGDGDGDGDPDTGDGDGDGDGDVPCADFDPATVVLGLNPITIVEGVSQLQASCGSAGPEAIHAFSAEADGQYYFAVLDADFEATLYLVDGICDPLAELACAVPPQLIAWPLVAGQSVDVVIDSSGAAGTATLEITTLP